MHVSSSTHLHDTTEQNPKKCEDEKNNCILVNILSWEEQIWLSSHLNAN